MALINPVIRSPVGFPTSNYYDVTRSVYNFDGVDDYGVLATRAINPDSDIDISWYQVALPASGTRVIITQCDSATLAIREFNFRWNSSALEMLVGGVAVIATADSVSASIGLWRVFYSGTTVQVFLNGVLIRTLTGRTRGAAREPAAPTRIGVRNNGGSLLEFYQGIIYNIRINGVLWQMSERNQNILLPTPTGLSAELITPTVLANPAVKGSQWTFLGDGRWQYVGDGTLNELRFIVSPSQPEAGYLEFEVESITGSMVCNTVGSTNAQFNSVGMKRYFYTQKLNSTSDGNTIVFKRVAGITASCIIKNISFKPLGTCNPLQLINTTSDRWQEIIEEPASTIIPTPPTQINYLAIANATGVSKLYSVSGETFTQLPELSPSVDPHFTYSADFSNNGDYLAFHVNGGSRLNLYKRSGNNFTRLTDPSQLPIAGSGRAMFSPNSEFLACANNGSNDGLIVYQRVGDTFNKIAAALQLSQFGAGVAWSKDSNYLAVSTSTVQPTILARSGTTFTKLANPETALPSGAVAMAFSPTSDLLVSVYQNAPRVVVSSITAGVHDRHTDPVLLPTNRARDVTFNHDGTLVAVGADDGLHIYSVSGTTLTKLTSPANSPINVKSVCFSTDGKLLFVGSVGDPYVTVYRVLGTAFTPITKPTGIPDQEVSAIGFY
jgi:WD40 repeat protein